MDRHGQHEARVEIPTQYIFGALSYSQASWLLTRGGSDRASNLPQRWERFLRRARPGARLSDLSGAFGRADRHHLL